MAAPRTNRLAGETSPYLLQHAENPVDWYPWGSEALTRAEAEDKPIFLSIGYSACHWCHVMERESFENDLVARLLNEHFIAIKVDREERPDLDEVYMAATIAMSGSGGWPMSVFLTPKQEPFFAGTYFPPTDRWGRPGFATLLDRIATLWRTQRDALVEQAGELTRHVQVSATAAAAAPVPSEAIDAAIAALSGSFDAKWGGFGGAPKFPPSSSLRLLLRRHGMNGETRPLDMVRRTLDGMKNGGMYDQLGGGFARYSTDERWLVPHFEKMLYDNAQLADVYLEAYQVTKDAEYRRVAQETLAYVVREMQSPEGGYYSATDADSEGEEGKFFVFQRDELDEHLPAELAERFAAYYDVSPEGNWEGKNILHTPKSLERVAAELGIARDELAESLAEARRRLYDVRQRRVPPLLDDKIITAWNGLMLRAMANGFRVLGEPGYLRSAESAADDLLNRLRTGEGALLRSARGKRAHLPAYLEDYAYLSDGLLTLYEASGQARYFDAAVAFAEALLTRFRDAETGTFFTTAHDHESLIARTREGHDGALPNPGAVAARALLRLSVHLGRSEFRDAAQSFVTAYGKAVERVPRAFATLLDVVDALGDPSLELVLVGAPEDPRTRALAAELAQCFLPHAALAVVRPNAEEKTTPLTEDKTLVGGAPALYICHHFACGAPITDAARVKQAVEKALQG